MSLHRALAVPLLMVIFGLIAGCASGSGAGSPVRDAKLVPASNERIVGQFGLEVAVPKDWSTVEPTCFVPKVIGYVAFHSNGVYNCPNVIASGKPSAPRPPSVAFSLVKDLSTPRASTHEVANSHGLRVWRSTTSCTEGDCEVVFIAGDVAVSVDAPRASIATVVAEVGTSLASVPEGDVAIPFQDSGTSRTAAAKVLRADGLVVGQDDGSAPRGGYGNVRPAAGTVVPRETRVVIVGG